MTARPGRAPGPLGTRDAEHRTLVVQTAFLGDLVLTLPLIHQLAQAYGPVDLVTTPEAAPIATGQPGVGRVIPFDKRGADRGVGGLFRLAAALRATGYARAFLPHPSLRSALLARLAGIPERTGFAGGLPGWLHTRRVPRPATGHESTRLAALAPSLPRAAPASAWLTLAPADTEAAGHWLAAAGVSGEYLVLAPGARWATKRWPHFPALAAALPGSLVVIGGPGDEPLAHAIADAAPGRVAAAAGRLTLPESAAVIAGARLVVTNDSVPLHLAVALGRPVLVVAGPTGPWPGFEPPTEVGEVVALPGLACRPCSRHGHTRCPLGHHRCMRELEPAQVLGRVRGMLARNGGAAGAE